MNASPECVQELKMRFDEILEDTDQLHEQLDALLVSALQNLGADPTPLNVRRAVALLEMARTNLGSRCEGLAALAQIGLGYLQLQEKGLQPMDAPAA